MYFRKFHPDISSRKVPGATAGSLQEGNDLFQTQLKYFHGNLSTLALVTHTKYFIKKLVLVKVLIGVKFYVCDHDNSNF